MRCSYGAHFIKNNSYLKERIQQKNKLDGAQVCVDIITIFFITEYNQDSASSKQNKQKIVTKKK